MFQRDLGSQSWETTGVQARQWNQTVLQGDAGEANEAVSQAPGAHRLGNGTVGLGPAAEAKG